MNINNADVKISPNKVRYIKLGQQGGWEEWCLDEGYIRLGYEGMHQECLSEQWDKVYHYWLVARGQKSGIASNDLRQIKDFYELPTNDLWITFYARKLYWCHTESLVREITDHLGEDSRVRKAINGWSSTDINGKELTMETIDGRLLKTQNYRGTICSINDANKEYLINKINGNLPSEVKEAEKNIADLKESVKELISGLWWNDFELLVDLIFANSGWQRISILGKTEKDIDLDLFSSVSQKRSFVQIKSSSDIGTYQKYCDSFLKSYCREHGGAYDEMYFVFHNSNGQRFPDYSDKNIHILDMDKISDLVINTGLIKWLITKRS